MTTTRPVFDCAPGLEQLELHDIIMAGPSRVYDPLGALQDLRARSHRMVGSLRGTHGYLQAEASDKALTITSGCQHIEPYA